MLYHRSFTIENRLQTVLRLISTGQFSTPELADEVGVSVPTISRDLTALRQRGHSIRAVRLGTHWRYVISSPPANENQRPTKPQRSKPR